MTGSTKVNGFYKRGEGEGGMCSCPGDNTYFDMPSNSCACTEPGYKFSSDSQCCVISGSGYPSGHERRNKININFSGLGAVEIGRAHV